MIFGIENWNQTFKSRQDPRDILVHGERPSLTFNSPVNAVLAAGKSYDDRVRMHSLFCRALRDTLLTRAPKEADRASAPNFFRYVDTEYGIFQRAARGSEEQDHTIETGAAAGLLREIITHGETLCAGQCLFHGQEDVPLMTTPDHHGFISTSLNPGVAITHAIRNGVNSKPVVYVLTLVEDMKALWHHDEGSSAEFEFLLPTGLMIETGMRHVGNDVDVLEVSVGRQSLR